MRMGIITFFSLFLLPACAEKPVILLLVQKYQVQAGDLFYWRGDGQFVLLSRGKANDVRVAANGVQAAAFEDRIMLSRKAERKPGDFIPPGGGLPDVLESVEFARTESPVRTLAFSRDGDLLAGGAADGRIWIWSVAAQQALNQFQDEAEIQALAFSPDGKALASALGERAVGTRLPVAGKHVHIWTIERALVTDTFGDAPAQALAFAADGRLAVGCANGDLLIRPSAGGEAYRVQASSIPVTALAWHPNGNVLASGHTDKAIRLWDPSSGKRTSTVTTEIPPNPLFPKGVERVEFDAAGSRLGAAFADGELGIWDVSPLNLRPR